MENPRIGPNTADGTLNVDYSEHEKFDAPSSGEATPPVVIQEEESPRKLHGFKVSL